jgi:biotin transport system substrate-specific component
MSGKKFLSTQEIVLCAFFAALIAVGAFLMIPIPVVPFTLQLLFTNLAGLLLGKKLGSISVAVYILLGLSGVPVFTRGGGIKYLLQPTFGYIIGFLPGTYAAGYITWRVEHPSFKRALAASVVNLCIVYFLGVSYFYLIANYYMGGEASIGIWALVLHGAILVLPGDVVSCFVCAALLRKLNFILEGRTWKPRRQPPAAL